MKKKLPIIVFALVVCLVSFIVFVAYRVSNGEIFDSGTSIHISDNDHWYELVARYPSRLTPKVNSYINARLHTDFFSADHRDEDLTLDDDTQVTVWNRRGKLIIRLVKGENSPAACERIKKLVADLKDRLSD